MSNDKMMTYLEDELDTIEHEWKASDRHVRYVGQSFCNQNI